MAVEIKREAVMGVDMLLTLAIDLAVMAAELAGKDKAEVIKMIDAVDVERHSLIEKMRERISQ